MHRCTHTASKRRVELPSRHSSSSLILQTQRSHLEWRSIRIPPPHPPKHKQSHPPAPSAPMQTVGREPPSVNTPCAFVQPSSFLSRSGHSCVLSVLLNGGTRSFSEDIPLLQMQPKIFPMMQLQFPFLLLWEKEVAWTKQSKCNVRTMVPISYNNVLLAIFQFPRNPNSMFLHRFCALTAAIFLKSSFFAISVD